MKVAGIDIGSSTAKAVILNGDAMIHSIHPIRNPWRVEAESILESALGKANLEREDLDFVIATGLVGDDWEGADDYLSDVSSAANGAMYYFPSVRTIIDIGAESCRVEKCDEAGIVTDYKMNQKCGSGTGLFLDVVAEALEVPVDEMGNLSLTSNRDIVMNATCAVFAESEVVSLIHLGEKRADILKAIFEMIAAKTASMARSIKPEEDIVLIGGAAKNIGLVKALSNALGAPVKVPENPELVVALGAAIEARELA